MTTRTTYPNSKPSGFDWLGDIPGQWAFIKPGKVLERNVIGGSGNDGYEISFTRHFYKPKQRQIDYSKRF